MALGLKRLAGHAVAFDQDLADAGDIERLLHLVVWKSNALHAGHRTAIDTDKMRMATSVMRWIANFEPPNMIT